MKTSIRELKNSGIARVTYPQDLRKVVDQVSRAWQELSFVRTEIKQRFGYDREHEVGYEVKTGEGKNADRKENLDITLGGAGWLREQAVRMQGADHAKQFSEFIEGSLKLIESLEPLIMDFAQKAENEFGLTGFAKEVQDSRDSFFVRFIRYNGYREPGEKRAAAHCDQSAFTLHLFETESGLQSLGFDKKWSDMPVSEDETVIIPAMQMQLRSHNEIRALCHRVIATPQSASERDSAVCFIQLKNTAKYDKQKHGRLQEKPPGSNYSMPLEEFSKLFKA